MAPVAGAIVIVVVLFLFPVMVLMSGAAGAALLGFLVKKSVDSRHAGSELIELNN